MQREETLCLPARYLPGPPVALAADSGPHACGRPTAPSESSVISTAFRPSACSRATDFRVIGPRRPVPCEWPESSPRVAGGHCRPLGATCREARLRVRCSLGRRAVSPRAQRSVPPILLPAGPPAPPVGRIGPGSDASLGAQAVSPHVMVSPPAAARKCYRPVACQYPRAKVSKSWGQHSKTPCGPAALVAGNQYPFVRSRPFRAASVRRPRSPMRLGFRASVACFA